MSLLDDIASVRKHLEQNGRISFRVIKREFDLDDDGLEDIVEELVEIQHVAKREEKALQWIGDSSVPAGEEPTQTAPNAETPAPNAYTPKHLAEKILQSRSAIEGEQKPVTVLFADVKDSMELAGQLGPERWHQILDQFFSILADGIHQFEGTINQYTGDGIMALFGAPIAHEDHAQRACYAVLQLRDRLSQFSARVRAEEGVNFSVRIGINSGDVVVGKIGDDLRMDYTAQGQTVGIAQRIEQLAESGRVYVGQATERLVRGYFQLNNIGPAKLKGVDETTEIFELKGVSEAHSRIEVAEARGLTKFVGRSAEMETLESALERAKTGHGQVVGVVGDPGLGKSRLCYEFAKHCRSLGIPVYEAHCPAHGKNVPFLPILELFRNYFGIIAQDTAAQSRDKITRVLQRLETSLSDSLPILFEFMGITDPGGPPPTLPAETRQKLLFELIHAVTRAQSTLGATVVVLIDDLHWVDPGSDLYIEQMVEAVDGNRSLLLLNFRPEYTGSWTHKGHYQQLPLIPLESKDVGVLLEALLGTDKSLAELKTKILEWTEGNPFFSEEVVRTLIETGAVQGDDGHYRLLTDIDALEVPTNVRAVLAARIDRLHPDAKHVLQRAAVIGKSFDAQVLNEIVAITGEALQTAIDSLKRSEFIHETGLYPLTSYEFKHPLSNEVAYESLLGSSKNETHEAVALAIERHAGERLDETAPLLAHHWDTAGNTERALEWHQLAAEWAEMNDAPASLRHWLRVRALINEMPSEQDVLSLGALACTHILLLSWRLGAVFEEAEQIFEDGAELARRADNKVVLSTLTGAFSVVCASTGRAREYCEYGVTGMELADETGDRGLRGSMRHFASHGYLFLGILDKAIDIATEGYELLPDDPNYGAQYTGSSPRLSMLFALQAAAMLQGRFTDSNKYYAETKRLCELGNFGDQVMWGRSLTPWQAILQGTSVDPKIAAEGIELGERLGTWFSLLLAYWCASLTHRANDDQRQALATFERYAEIENGVPFIISPTMHANYADVLLENGDIDQSIVQATLAIEQNRSSGFAFDPRPWYALARSSITSHDQETAKRALDDLHEEIKRITAWAYSPFLHEERANYAAAFHDTWQYDDEIRKAHRLFTKLGASGHAKRMATIIRAASA